MAESETPRRKATKNTTTDRTTAKPAGGKTAAAKAPPRRQARSAAQRARDAAKATQSPETSPKPAPAKPAAAKSAPVPKPAAKTATAKPAAAKKPAAQKPAAKKPAAPKPAAPKTTAAPKTPTKRPKVAAKAPAAPKAAAKMRSTASVKSPPQIDAKPANDPGSTKTAGRAKKFVQKAAETFTNQLSTGLSGPFGQELQKAWSVTDASHWATSDIERWKTLTEQMQRVVAAYLDHKQADKSTFSIPDPGVLGKAFGRLGQSLAQNPLLLMKANTRLALEYTKATAQALAQAAGAMEPDAGGKDKRFKDAAWQDDAFFHWLRSVYGATADTLVDTVDQVEDLDPKTTEIVRFYTRRFADLIAPSNVPFLNPQVVRETLDSKGENVMRGLGNLLEDLERGKGKLSISMVDKSKFEMGKNIATTPGKVVFQNELMQLIQYSPTTETVYKTPLLIAPPWINKFYILDLRPENSFIKWAVDQGITVFVISWVNPTGDLSHKTFDDYMVEGPLAALDAVEQATGERQVNMIGYCIGGTLMSATLSYLRSKKDDRVKSCTFFTALTDFAEAGDLRVFVSDEQLDLLEKHMSDRGILEGSFMGNVFNLMRANDLIWSFVVNNYYLGKDPMAFDLLYWNSDATRMPAMQQSFYLRNMYLDNKLREPGGISMKGVPVDLRTVKTPAYFLSTKEDHIAPWRATYAATQLFSGPVTFVLSGSGHVAGVVNPPKPGKYPHWTNDALPADPEEWFNGATHRDGSWWTHWSAWLAQHGGPQVPARIPGAGKLKPIEDAPGSYVKVMAPG